MPQAPDRALRSAEALHTWLSPWQARTSLPLEWVARLGVFSLFRSFWFKLPLALIGLLVMVRSAALCESWPRLTLRRRAASLSLALGLVLLLSGGLLQWARVSITTDLEAWPDSPLRLPDGTSLPVSAQKGMALRWAGDTLFVSRRAAHGLILQAYDTQGQPLHLTTSPHEEGTSTLRLVLDAQHSEAYCALPDAGLVLRIYLLDAPSRPPLRVEIYRATSGVLVSSTDVQHSVHIFTDKAVLNLHQVNVQYVDGISYPGWPALGAGALLVLLGWIGQRIPLLPLKFSLRRRQ